MKKLHPLHLTCAVLAACSFALLTGCDNQAATDVDPVAATETDHDHDGNHDHEHADGEHSHADGEHAHADGEHADGEHAHGDHDHDFESLGEATNEIEALAAEIGKQLSAGDADAAHDPLHHIRAVLLATEEVVKKMEDSEKKTELSAAVTSLLDDFTEIDSQLHGSSEKEADPKEAVKKYQELQPAIDDAIAKLKKG